MSDIDIVVIGSGIGGLCSAALLAKYGFSVVVCESHNIAGGAAHGFERNGFKFDSGPSLYSGLSYSPSPNPLRQVLDAIEEDAQWINYDAWGCYLPEGNFIAPIGETAFDGILQKIRGPEAVNQWKKLQKVMKPLAEATYALPTSSVRLDLGALFTLSPYLPTFLRHGWNMGQLTGNFGDIMDQVITDPFIRNWLDLLCFLLSGLPASQTSAAEMAFMFGDWYRPDVKLDYPMGGSEGLVNALVRGLEKYGGKLQLNAHVDQIILENNQATGVILRDKTVIKAKKAVISNASIWDTLNLLPESSSTAKLKQERQKMPPCNSFMHLHLGIDKEGLPPDLECHYTTVDDWEKGISAPHNVIVLSIPSVLDPSLAPAGKHTVHVYTPANEPYALWEGVKRNSPEYTQLKKERAEPLWQALERIIPDIRSRCEVTLVGTPLTHQRFLRRYRGSYGPAMEAGRFPSPLTPVSGLYCCGDSVFPGIGLPAVAASGMLVANTLASVSQQFKVFS
ncbi:MAG: phytoene desaturase family protein [Microcystaceae cyanobacterium]